MFVTCPRPKEYLSKGNDTQTKDLCSIADLANCFRSSHDQTS